jgi:signal transduction histidine kinase
MPDNLLLFIHNVGYIASALLLISIGIIIIVKDRHSLANKMLLAGFAAVVVFLISHVIAVNIADSHLSRKILTFNLSNIYISLFITHSVLAFLGKVKEQKKALGFMYAFSIFLTLLFLLVPNLFLLDSVPKMYFPNYYQGGSLYWLLITWNFSVIIYSLAQMIRAYRTADKLLKNRLKYFFTALFCGYLFGGTAYPLVLGIPVNPVWSIFMVPSFATIFTYAILKYELLDIRVVFKQAFAYSILVGGVGIFIILFNALNNFIIQQIPGFPLWLLPLISSGAAVAIGFYIWNKFREGELLKYEFISVVTHKFQTPLTHIKWASENMATRPRKDEDQAQLSYIKSANAKLIELTDLLMTVSESESSSYSYKFSPRNLSESVSSVLAGLKAHLSARSINLTQNVATDVTAPVDESRIRFVMQTLVENAINYTPVGGTVTVTLEKQNSSCLFSVKDSGIGISKDELPLLFSKFYRGKRAKLTDTEGMGIGLYIAQEIIQRHTGKIWAQSEGEGKGSTFSFTIPLTT